MNKSIFFILLQISLINAAADQEVCYDDLGCFSTAPPFSDFGRIALLPDSPEDINTQFMLYTRLNSDTPHEIKAGNIRSLQNSNFDGSKPIKFIIHGFIDSPRLGSWMADMARQFLIAEDCNAFVVDWSDGGQALYGQACANTRVAGAEIARLVDYLQAEAGADPAKVHILGHSLGAQVAGYAGERIQGLARITGLDPADPYFQNMSTVVRLDEGDAAFVDIVHTDASDIFNLINPFDNMQGMGMWQPCGHVDVYPNGGKLQPGCDHGPIHDIIGQGVVEGMRDIVACAHMRAYEYVHETIASNCPWRSYSCPNWDEFKTGRCLRCPTSGDRTKECNSLGTMASKPSDGSVNNMYWMMTGDRSPFCRYHYHIQLTLANEKNKDQKGIVWVKLYGDGKETDFMQLGEDNFYLSKGASYDFLVTTKLDMKSISSVELKWEEDAFFLDPSQWEFGKPGIYPQSVGVFSGEYQNEKVFCDNSGDELKSKDSRRLRNTC